MIHLGLTDQVDTSNKFSSKIKKQSSSDQCVYRSIDCSRNILNPFFDQSFDQTAEIIIFYSDTGHTSTLSLNHPFMFAGNTGERSVLTQLNSPFWESLSEKVQALYELMISTHLNRTTCSFGNKWQTARKEMEGSKPNSNLFKSMTGSKQIRGNVLDRTKFTKRSFTQTNCQLTSSTDSNNHWFTTITGSKCPLQGIKQTSIECRTRFKHFHREFSPLDQTNAWISER